VPSPYVISDDFSNSTYLNIDFLLNLVIKLTIIYLHLLLFNSILIIIFGGYFIFMENGSSSSSQGQGSNNFTGGGSGGNNGNGPNPGGNNFNSPAAADEGNNRRNRSTFFETVLGTPHTDCDMLADYLQVKLDEFNKNGVNSPKGVYSGEVGLRLSPHRALQKNTLYPSMVITYLEDKYKKERVFPLYKSFLEAKANGTKG